MANAPRESTLAALGPSNLTPNNPISGLTVSGNGPSLRTRLMIEGPILSTLLRLSLPNIVLMVVQAAMGALETYYVSGLGTDALAGVIGAGIWRRGMRA